MGAGEDEDVTIGSFVRGESGRTYRVWETSLHYDLGTRSMNVFLCYVRDDTGQIHYRKFSDITDGYTPCQLTEEEQALWSLAILKG